MKLQLSLELLAYVSLAFISLGIITNALYFWNAKVEHFSGEYNMYMLAQRINSAILSGDPHAYLIASNTQICNLTVENGTLYTIYGNFSIIGNINTTAFC